MSLESVDPALQQVVQNNQETANLLQNFLGDLNLSTLQTQNAGFGATVLVGSGGDADTNSIVTPPTQQIEVKIAERPGVELAAIIPAATGLAQNLAQTSSAAEAVSYISNFIEQFTPKADDPTIELAPALKQQLETLNTALEEAVELLQAASGGDVGSILDLTIRNISFFTSGGNSGSALQSSQQAFTILDSDGTFQGIDSLVGTDDVLMDAAGSTGQQLWVINLAGLGTKTLALANVDAAVLASAGTVKVEGTKAIHITTDNQAQNLTGGVGNDTLVGSGNDTLAGGAGNDVFGFAGTGKYTISDFSKSGDMLAFNIPNLNNLDQLKANVTSVVKTATSITYNFGPDASITLVGVSASDLTASMIKFTL